MASARENSPALALFDLDGTLLHTMPDIAFAVNGALALQGLPPYGEGEVALMVGGGVEALAKRALPEKGDRARFLPDYKRIYAENLTARTRPYPGVARAVSELRQAGVKTAVLSNKPHGDTVRLVSELFGGGAFDAVWGQRDGVPLKPDPGPLFEAEGRFGALRRRCVLIGDSDADAGAAKNAGWAFVGVTWGYRSREVLLAAGAAVLADSPEELAGLVLSML